MLRRAFIYRGEIATSGLNMIPDSPVVRAAGSIVFGPTDDEEARRNAWAVLHNAIDTVDASEA